MVAVYMITLYFIMTAMQTNQMGKVARRVQPETKSVMATLQL